MARTAITVATITRAGITPTTPAVTDVSNGNVAPNDGNTWLEFTNTDAGTQTVTLHPARTVDGQAVAGVAHSMAAAAVLRVGPFPTDDYSGQLAFNTSVTALKVAAYRLPE